MRLTSKWVSAGLVLAGVSLVFFTGCKSSNDAVNTGPISRPKPMTNTNAAPAPGATSVAAPDANNAAPATNAVTAPDPSVGVNPNAARNAESKLQSVEGTTVDERGVKTLPNGMKVAPGGAGPSIPQSSDTGASGK